jgi:hypothetical protein
MSRLPEGLVVAIIAATSAIAGTLVGAIVTYEGDQALQNRQVEREEARQTTAARAVARLLMGEYHADSGPLEEMVTLTEYNPEIYRQRLFVSHIDQEDRKLLAGRLSEQDWTDVSEASQELESVEGYMEAHRGAGKIGPLELKEVERAFADGKAAYTALSSLAAGTKP